MPESESQRALRAERFAARVEVDGRLVAVDAPRHGDANIYVGWGCRCPPCTAANTEACRRRQTKTSPEDERSARQWWVPTTMHAALESHVLAAGSVSGVRSALCGRRHRTWQELERFTAPDQIRQCRGCAVAIGPQRRDGDGPRRPREPATIKLTIDERRRAIHTAARHATDSADLIELLDVLGLDARELTTAAATSAAER